MGDARGWKNLGSGASWQRRLWAHIAFVNRSDVRCSSSTLSVIHDEAESAKTVVLREHSEAERKSVEPADAEAELSELSPCEMALFTDIVRYSDSGIVERYRRLGINVRQGQKLKRTLIERSLLREQVKMTSRNKLWAIWPTETGLEIHITGG